MSNFYYIDTCSLQWRYVSGAPTATVDALLDDPDKVVFTSELTLLEWSSTLARTFRRKKITQEDFKRNELALMSDVLTEKLQVWPPLIRAVEKARYLMEYVGVDRGLNLGSGDALHLVYAIEAASHVAGPVTVVTSNKAVANIVRTVRLNLQLLHLPPTPPTVVTGKDYAAILRGYGFTDQSGQPLENCQDFIDAIEELKQLRHRVGIL
jgi:PIN domain